MTRLPKSMDAVDGPLKPILEIEFEDDVRYSWVDEDERRVSPVHGDFGKALTYYQNWDSAWERIARHEAKEIERLDVDNPHEWQVKQREDLERRVAESRRKLTLTGKRPVKLYRLTMTTTVGTISDAEGQVVDALKEASGGV